MQTVISRRSRVELAFPHRERFDPRLINFWLPLNRGTFRVPGCALQSFVQKNSAFIHFCAIILPHRSV